MLAAALTLGGTLGHPGHLSDRARPAPAVVSDRADSAPAVGTDSAGSAPAGVSVPTAANKLLGQRIMVGFSGTAAPLSLLSAVKAGQVGSVILFAANIVNRSQTVAMTNQLQRWARAGGNSKLLIAVDQEGGEVKRIPSGPPTLSPPQMAATHKVSVAAAQGRATGSLLKGWGINLDLAPVSDVPTFGGAFIWQQGRAFSFNAGTVASFASAFAFGLQARGVAATANNFPGLGSAPIDTDFKRQELHPTAKQRAAALKPYEQMIPKGLDVVMLTVAGFPAYDQTGASAALSRPIIQNLLRGKLKFRGVAITDALGTPTGHDERAAGVLAATAGSDILLYTDSAPGELAALRSALQAGKITTASADASYQRIMALKTKLGLA